MKKNLLFLFSVVFFHISFAQQIFFVAASPIAFQKNSKIFLQLPEKSKPAEELTNFTNLENKIWNEDVLVFFPEQVSQNLILQEGWVLFSAIQSPYDQTNWICLERTIMGNDFNLFLFDTNTGFKKILINNANSIGNYAFHALCWSANKNTIYLERLEFDTGYEHEGIYSYALETGELKQLAISNKYMTTPLISPDRKRFTYLATSDLERELIHGVADKLMVYTIENNEELLLSEETGSMHQVLGWYTNESFQKKQLGPPSNNNLAQLNFKLPWPAGTTYCVTRDGSNAPPPPVGSNSSCTNLGPHSYPAATDYDTPNNADDKVLAVAAGTVTTVIYSNTGYGNHIIITHSDNFRTRYGHNKSIAVTVGQQVQQGCYIAIEGTTGNSSGDHIHLEYESPGGGSNVYAQFSDCGNCVPHRGYNYTSTNSISPCTVTPPPPAPTITSSNTCGDKTITRASPPSGTTYYWQGTSCGTSVANSALNYNVSASGTYYLRAKNSIGWSSTCSSKIVTINDIPNNPPPPTTTTNPCSSQTLTRGTPPSGVTFYWQGTSCGTSTTSSALTYTAPSTGTYRLRAKQNSGGCWSTACSSVAVTVAPTPATPPVPSASTNSCGSVTLTMPNAPSGETYYWQGSACGINTTNASSTYIVTVSGTYYLRSLSSQACWSSCRSVAVSIIDCPENLLVSFGPCSPTMVNFSWINSNVNWTLQVSLDSAFNSFYSKSASNVTLLTGPAGFTPALNFQANATYFWRILTGNVYTYGPSFTLPFCDVIAPNTAIAPVLGWQSTNFTANFTDADNSGGSGLGKSFYRVLDFDGTEWRANGSRGFANDNFDNTILNPDWTTHSGSWANASGYLEQSNQTLNNTNISAPLTQNLSNRYLYHWNAKIDGTGTNRKAGFHFFSDNASLPNRGNSYLVWFSMDDHKLEFYKVTNDLMTLVKSRNYSFVAGLFYDFKLVYDRINGKMDIYINNIIAESWADATPIATGNAVSFRTADANMTINYFKTFRSRLPSLTINVGAGNTNDIRFENSGPPLAAGKVESIVTDSAGNLSPLVSIPVDVDWTAPSTVAFINDGSGADIATTYSTNELKANWSPSSDPNSGIVKYHYSIGTTPGDTNLVASTDNFMQMIAINTPLPLVLNQLYYFNVRSENGAGLFSSIASSNGQMVVLNTTSIEEEITVLGLNLYPNPFNNTAALDYTLTRSEKVQLGLYDVLGKEIVSLKNENQATGNHKISIDGTELKLSKGLYLLVLKTENTSAFIKIVFD
ncbi:MAG: peptidoglycan DD-metalloendopeptidase family protein [Bacteroidota bacterium]